MPYRYRTLNTLLKVIRVATVLMQQKNEPHKKVIFTQIVTCIQSLIVFFFFLLLTIINKISAISQSQHMIYVPHKFLHKINSDKVKEKEIERDNVFASEEYLRCLCVIL